MIIKKGVFDRPYPRDYIAKIGLLADVHVGTYSDHSVLSTIFANVNSKNVDFTFVLGDIIDSGYASTPDLMTSQLETLNTYIGELDAPVFKLRGNHDVSVTDFTDFGVVEFGDVRFICTFASYVDMPPENGASFASRGAFTAENVEWIREQLEKGQEKNNIILNHYPLHTEFGWCICDEVTSLYGHAVDGHRDDVIAIMREYGANLWLNGHTHSQGLRNADVDNLGITNVQIPSTASRFVVLTIYKDRCEFVEYNSMTDEVTETLTVNL